MKLTLRKFIAAISIYLIILLTFVIIFEPFGGYMSRQDWYTFWTWVFVPPIAFSLILLITIWAKGEKIKFDGFKVFRLLKGSNLNRIKLLSVKKFFIDFYKGNLSLPLSFFGFGFLGTIIIGSLAALIFQHIAPVRLIVVPWQIYAIIGIWAAADKYKGKKIFSILAKLIMIWWIINNVVKFIIYIS